MEKKGSYIINKETMSLIPKYDEFGNKYTLVYERNNTYFVDEPSQKIIEKSCTFYGSSYEGRVTAAKIILKKDKMLPVPISNSLGIYFFPVSSPKNPNCVWFSHKHIKGLEKCEKNQTRIILENQKPLIVDVAKRRMEIKLHRTAQLIFILESRNKE